MINKENEAMHEIRVYKDIGAFGKTDIVEVTHFLVPALTESLTVEPFRVGKGSQYTEENGDFVYINCGGISVMAQMNNPGVRRFIDHVTIGAKFIEPSEAQWTTEYLARRKQDASE
jgi:hypothetical protein